MHEMAGFSPDSPKDSAAQSLSKEYSSRGSAFYVYRHVAFFLYHSESSSCDIITSGTGTGKASSSCQAGHHPPLISYSRMPVRSGSAAIGRVTGSSASGCGSLSAGHPVEGIVCGGGGGQGLGCPVVHKTTPDPL